MDQTERVRRMTAETGSFRMDCFRFGHGERCLVILPGLSVQSVMGQAEAVAEAYRPLTGDFTVYVFDRRRDPPDSYTVDGMAEDTAVAVRTLGLGRVSLFGVSQGGMIAMKIAAAHPGLVDALVLGSTTARVTGAEYRVIENWIRLAREKNAAALYRAFAEAVYPKSVADASRELLDRAAETVTEEELGRFVVLAEAAGGFDGREDLQRITCPVLIIGDTDDRVLGPGAAESIRDCLGERPDAELYLYDGFGHAAYDIAPDYKERVLRFLLRHDPEKG